MGLADSFAQNEYTKSFEKSKALIPQRWHACDSRQVLAHELFHNGLGYQDRQLLVRFIV